MSNNNKGFTLIELLIVVAIVAILAVVVVLTLNPAQLLKQSRDSRRISELSTYKSAITLYLADISSPSIGTTTLCYAHASSSVGTSCTSGTIPRFTVAGTYATTTLTNTTGTGWIPLNFALITSGNPLSVEPVDPVNNSAYFYAYRAETSTYTFELNADMESTKYAAGGGSDVESTDGGNNNSLFEVGTDPALDL